MPISIMSLSTVRALDERLHAEVDQRRFRANIVVETFEDLAHVEDEWLGKSVLFGDRTDSARVRADRPIPRCMMVNLHPETATQDSRILRALAHSHDANAAIYASTEAPGTIEEGDTVYISEASSPSFT
jgi:uncharacterized protein YcbX